MASSNPSPASRTYSNDITKGFPMKTLLKTVSLFLTVLSLVGLLFGCSAQRAIVGEWELFVDIDSAEEVHPFMSNNLIDKPALTITFTKDTILVNGLSDIYSIDKENRLYFPNGEYGSTLFIWGEKQAKREDENSQRYWFISGDELYLFGGAFRRK